MATKVFCDKCKEEVTRVVTRSPFILSPGEATRVVIGTLAYDICKSCAIELAQVIWPPKS